MRQDGNGARPSGARRGRVRVLPERVPPGRGAGQPFPQQKTCTRNRGQVTGRLINQSGHLFPVACSLKTPYLSVTVSPAADILPGQPVATE